MSVCVSDLCKLPIFSNGLQLIAGQNGLNKEVSHVTVLESPAIHSNSVNNIGYFLLTTFYIYRNNNELIEKAMLNLAHNNISGLAIKCRFINDIPLDVIKIANEYDIPLFIIESTVMFNEIITAIISEIINYQFQIFKSMHEQHELLFGAILRGEKINYFMRIVGNNLRCNCFYLSAFGEILSQHIVEEKQNHNDIKSMLQTITKKTLEENNLSYLRIKPYYIFPCLVHNQIMGYFLLEAIDEINDYDLLLAQQMISFLSLKLLEKQLILETEQRMTTAIVDELLFKCYTDDSVIKERLSLLGFVPNEYYCVLYCSIRQSYKNNVLQFQPNLHSYSLRIKQSFNNCLVVLNPDGFIAIVSFSRNSRYNDSKKLRLVLKELAENKDLNNYIDIGYSLPQKNLTLIPDSYKAAKDAFKYGRIFAPDEHVYSYNDFVEARFVSGILGTKEYTFALDSIIMPIINHDKKHTTELWLTLEKCILIGTLEKAAKDLHIHSSTLRYRLQKIRDLTKLDFFTAQGKYLLNTAYLLAKIGDIDL